MHFLPTGRVRGNRSFSSVPRSMQFPCIIASLVCEHFYTDGKFGRLCRPAVCLPLLAKFTDNCAKSVTTTPPTSVYLYFLSAEKCPRRHPLQTGDIFSSRPHTIKDEMVKCRGGNDHVLGRPVLSCHVPKPLKRMYAMSAARP